MELLLKIWYNPKHRKIAIVVILGIILLLLLIYRVMTMEEPPPQGALRVVICRECGAKYETRIKDITDVSDERNYCKECHGKLSFVWKCDECQFEFPEPTMHISKEDLNRTMDKFKLIVESRRCPNCSSLATHPYSTKELKGGKIERDKIDIGRLRAIKK